jgi:hypothetical protein
MTVFLSFILIAESNHITSAIFIPLGIDDKNTVIDYLDSKYTITNSGNSHDDLPVTQTPTPTPTNTSTPTATPTNTSTPTATPTNTQTSSPTQTQTPSPTKETTPTPTPTQSPTSTSPNLGNKYTLL